MRYRKDLAAVTLAAALRPGPAVPRHSSQIESKFAEANGVRLHYLGGGAGRPVLLLHGFGQSSHMWRPLMRELAKNHTVIAADLRGAGQSDAPERAIEIVDGARCARAHDRARVRQGERGRS